jgi:UDP-2,3-diacylglucosamine hydrolase
VQTLFISDLHLSTGDPDRLQDFKQLLRGPARQARALYILGDIYEEFWVGNDDKTPPNQEIINELLNLSRSGTKTFFLKGNRELLMDKGFEVLSGVKLLPDHALIELYGERVLLMHGDLLCTRDHNYHLFRTFITNPLVRMIIRLLPYRLRIWLAHGIRPAMNRSMRQKHEDIMDVDITAVNETMQHYKVNEIIHGHTHRPGIHEFEKDGKPLRRIVLGDWYRHAEILICEDGSRHLVTLSNYLQSPWKDEAPGSGEDTTQG